MKDKVLHLTLNKKWFDLIASGVKIEEYREIKMYWWKRLVQCGECYSDKILDENSEDMLQRALLPPKDWKMIMAKDFDIVSANNGYTKDCPNIKWKHKGIRIGDGKPEWGAEPGKTIFYFGDRSTD
jgi:hypothetical protein